MLTPEFVPGLVGAAPVKPALEQFDQLSVVYNPRSEAAETFIGQLTSEYPSTATLEVTAQASEPDINSTIELIASKAKTTERRLWAVAGGDGTVSNFLGAATIRGLKDPVLVVPTGYANDIAHMLHSRKAFKQPLSHLSSAHVAKLRPLQIISREPAGEDDKLELAFGYFGIGLSGMKAADFDTQEFRDQRTGKGRALRHLQETKSVLNSLRHIDRFKLFNPMDTVAGQDRVELLFMNGNRMGNTIPFRVSLLDDEAGRIEMGHRNRLSLAFGLGRAAIGQHERFTSSDAPYTFTVETEQPYFTTQRDGEATHHVSETSFLVRLSPHTVNVLTTKRR